MSLSVMRTIGGQSVSFEIVDPEEKLSWRGSLPGASIYDEAAHRLRMLQTTSPPGEDASSDLLPLAFASSWYVNARASSRAMQRWLFVPEAHAAWANLLTVLAFDMSLEGWQQLADETKARVTADVATLANGVEGATVAAVTKVLALLRPQLVPLMDDAAVWFAIGGLPEPDRADDPKADASVFVPMMNWFAESVAKNESALVKLAVSHQTAVLDAPQVLDRLLWVVSWGDRLRARTASE